VSERMTTRAGLRMPSEEVQQKILQVISKTQNKTKRSKIYTSLQNERHMREVQFMQQIKRSKVGRSAPFPDFFR